MTNNKINEIEDCLYLWKVLKQVEDDYKKENYTAWKDEVVNIAKILIDNDYMNIYTYNIDNLYVFVSKSLNIEETPTIICLDINEADFVNLYPVKGNYNPCYIKSK